MDAIKYVESPLLVVAGPGTGKTRTIIEKVVYLVEELGYDPNKLLVVTFTIKAADELKDRLRKRLGDRVETMQISTIHSFCQRMLEMFPEYHNYGSVFEVMDELDQFIYVDNNYRGFGLNGIEERLETGKRIRFVDKLTNFYNLLTENDIDPIALKTYYSAKRSLKTEELLTESYEYYEAELDRTDPKKLDFAMLQKQFYHMLLNNEDALNSVREMFDYIFVDEYQDTNPIQDAIIRLIAEPKFNITVVGDEDQSIYGFRGASVENFRQFLERYSVPENTKACMIKLEENFRSPEEIVDAFDKFMGPHRTFEKKIVSKNGHYSDPVLIVSESPEEESIRIAEWIEKLISNHNVDYGDIAVLFKSVRNHANELVDELMERNIPYVVYGDSSLIDQPEIRSVIHAMACINEYELNEKVSRNRKLMSLLDYDILSSDLLNLDEKTVEKLDYRGEPHKFCDIYNYEGLKNQGIATKDIDTLINIKNIRNKDVKKPQLDIFYELMDATGYLRRLFEASKNEADIHNAEKAELQLKNLAKFTTILEKFKKNTGSNSFKSFIYLLTKIPDNKLEDAASPEGQDVVKIMTIHQAKGLEFPVVILGGVTERRYDARADDRLVNIPKQFMMNKHDVDFDEEVRRVFYVGMSRAQKLLTISAIDGRNRKMSKFIGEIGDYKFISPSAFIAIFGEDDHYVPVDEKIRMTYSSVNYYMDCPFRFYLYYVLGFVTPEWERQIYGSIIHNCLKKLHIMMSEGKNISIRDIMGIVDKYCKEENTKKYRSSVIDLVRDYHKNAKEFIGEIVDVERPFTYINSDLVVNGQADLVIRDKNGELCILDFKSMTKKGIESTNVEIQLQTYGMALSKVYPEPISHLIAYSIEDNHMQHVPNSEEGIQKTQKLIMNVEDSINNKEFERNWGCKFCNTTEGKCPFYGLCYKLEGANNGK